MNKIKIGGIASVVLGIPLAIAGAVASSRANSQLEELDKEGVEHYETAYKEAVKTSDYGSAGVLGGLALTVIGIPLSMHRKKRMLCEVKDFAQYENRRAA